MTEKLLTAALSLSIVALIAVVLTLGAAFVSLMQGVCR